MTTSRTAFVVAEDAGLAAEVGRLLRGRGYAVESAADGADAEARLARGLPDLLVVQRLLPGRSGLSLAERAKELGGGRVRVVMLAAGLSPAHRDYALAAGVDAIVPTPLDPADLLAAADRPPARPTPLVRIGRPTASAAL